MKAKVIENMCIGCGACTALVPEEFDINDEGIAYNLNSTVNKENEELVEEAKDNCPTGAINVTKEEA